jgi:transcription elongation factor Elf1
MSKEKEINVSAYLNAPYNCPFCGSDSIDADPFTDHEDIYAWKDIKCKDCGRKWQEEYVITNVRAYDNGGHIEED